MMYLIFVITFVNATMYPQHNSNFFLKKRDGTIAEWLKNYYFHISRAREGSFYLKNKKDEGCFSSKCHNKLPLNVCLKTQMFISHSPHSWKVKDQDLGRYKCLLRA
jgi:hypothetical protein